MVDLKKTLNWAFNSLEMGRYGEVVSHISPLLRIHAQDPYIPLVLGLALGLDGRPLEASEMFARVVERDPDLTEAHFNLAKSLKDLGRLSEAETAYKNYLQHHPKDTAALYNFANLLVEENRMAEAEAIFYTLLEEAPNHLDGKHNLALLLYRQGKPADALALLDEVLESDGDHGNATRLQRGILSDNIPFWHFLMLNDQTRNDSYEAAIAAHVSGKNVFEIGTGAGLLAMMAARHGAKSVVSCEMSEPLAYAAKKIVEDNRLSEKVQIVPRKSTQLTLGEELPQRADVLVAEVLDAGLLGEGFIPALIHAREELLSPDAILIPSHAKVIGMLIECKKIRQISPIHEISGFDLSYFDRFRRPGYFPVDLSLIDFRPLSKPFVLSKLDFRRIGLAQFTDRLRVPVHSEGICQALTFWFELELGPGISISTSPDNRKNHWKQAMQFFENDHHISPGEQISLEITRHPTGFTFKILQ